MTGFLVPVNDKKAVLKVTEQIINMSVEQRQQMGMLGRKRIQEKFDRKIVVKTYIEEIKKINLKGKNE